MIFLCNLLVRLKHIWVHKKGPETFLYGDKGAESCFPLKMCFQYDKLLSFIFFRLAWARVQRVKMMASFWFIFFPILSQNL